VRRRRGQQLERQRQQRVSRQDRGPFVEGLVHGGLTAAQIVVVHGRQVVVNERIAVHALERRRRFQRGLMCNAEQAGALEHQKGTQPLAAAESPQPHGLDQPMRGAARRPHRRDARQAALRRELPHALAVG
jgi:hypothetical protein